MSQMIFAIIFAEKYGSDAIVESTMHGVSFLSSLMLFILGIFFIFIIALFIIDVTQTKDTVRRNYPVLGRFRGLFTKLGEFFRQYFFALDREEMPFNRAERDWVYHVASEGSDVVPFGSTKVLAPGTPIFANGLFPKLDGEEKVEAPFIIGPDTPNPYQPTSFFNISAMSYGSLSKPAVEALSHGASMAGCWLNTGEGGVSPYHLEGDCHVIYQLGTAKFGARNDDGTLNAEKLSKICENPKIKMIEIKLSQGAKPGKGGILPASKVDAEVAEIRGIPVGKAALSPNRGIKFVVGNVTPLSELFDEVLKRGLDSAPDFITVDSGDGGTGAAPLPLIDNMGLTIRESLPLMDDMLREKGLRDRIKIIASGKLITPADVAWAFCAGADLANAARGFMFALGCIQALKCDQNTCPTGITTHDKRLQRGLDPTNKAVRVMNYVKNMQKEVNIIAHSCGVDNPRDLTRQHLMIIQPTGRSKPFDQVWDRSRYN